jgi:hypothetical protein
MLRRDFIKTASITLGGLGGLIALGHLPSFAAGTDDRKSRRKKRRAFHLHGDARSGCATPPELADLLEKGISYAPH